jgi:hypothetical protein
MKALVTGWFSFEQMGATAGDLLARDLVVDWLEEAGCSCDVAVAPPFSGGVDWRMADPSAYSHVVFVCGPFGNGPPVTALLERFAGCQLIGVDLSMLQPLEEWNPFHLLLERDSSRTTRPDISLAAMERRVPVVGVVLVHRQSEYGHRGRHQAVEEAVATLLASRDVAVVPIDTRLDVNRTGLRTAAQVESLIARMDVVITTRLHGLVLALKNRVPAIAIDPIMRGAKVRMQAETLAWPIVFTPETLSDEALQHALNHCLTPEARAETERCRARAIMRLEEVRARIASSLAIIS